MRAPAPRRAAAAGAALLSVLVGCASSRTETEGASTQVTAAELDSDTGPCVCRLPEDEGMTCCRNGLALACTCQGRWSCQVTPTGRACGSAGAKAGTRR